MVPLGSTRALGCLEHFKARWILASVSCLPWSERQASGLQSTTMTFYAIPLQRVKAHDGSGATCLRCGKLENPGSVDLIA